MVLFAISAAPQSQQPQRTQRTQQQPQQPPKKGPADLAKALGITEEKLKSMSQQEVMKLARDNGVNLNDYARPGEPPQQSQNRQQQPNSVFRP